VKKGKLKRNVFFLNTYYQLFNSFFLILPFFHSYQASAKHVLHLLKALILGTVMLDNLDLFHPLFSSHINKIQIYF